MGWQTTLRMTHNVGLVMVLVVLVAAVYTHEVDARSSLCIKPKMDCDPALMPELYLSDTIINGQVAEPGSTPWLISLQDTQYDRPVHFCGATLLNHFWVLTTASCVVSYWDGFDIIQVVAGEYDLDKEEGWEQVRRVWKIEVHPKYKDLTRDFDVALIMMNFPVFFNERINPLPLPTNRPLLCQQGITFYEYSYGNDLYLIVGWGSTKETGEPSSVVLQAYTPVLPRQECIDAYPNQITDTMICAGNLTYGGLDPCQGDWGGALVSKDGFVTGLASWSVGCGRPGYPGVYTNVDSVVDWICDVTSFLNDDRPYSLDEEDRQHHQDKDD